MEKRSIERIVRSLNDASVRYLIAGGLAVVAHGFVRFTADVDLIIDLESSNLRRAVAALAALGYRPHAPVGLDEFTDPEKRALWVREKGLTVFSLFSAAHPATEVDIFVEAPFDFDAAYRVAVRMDLGRGLGATFVSLQDLIDLKQRAGRPQDAIDIEKLRALQRGRADE